VLASQGQCDFEQRGVKTRVDLLEELDAESESDFIYLLNNPNQNHSNLSFKTKPRDSSEKVMNQS
jgi:hypothetical protein